MYRRANAATVEYTDPSNTYRTISQELLGRLPLRNLHWNSSSRPLRSIKSLHVDLVPDDKRSSQTTPLAGIQTPSQNGTSSQNLADRPRTGDRPAPFTADSSAKKERRHQIPGLRQTPYLKIYILRCDDVDSYKASSRKLIREWVKDHTPPSQKSSKYNTQENHDAFEWLILHVVSADDVSSSNKEPGEGKGESRWSKRSSSNLIEKIRTDFNGTSKSAVDRVAQVYISGETTGQSSDDGDTGWGDLIFKMKSLILASFDLRVRQYEEDIREKESQRSLPGWNFNTFFVLKEGLAMGFESVGLVEDALTSYHELDVGLHAILEERYADGSSSTSTAQFQEYTDDLLMEVKEAAAVAFGCSKHSDGADPGLDQQLDSKDDLGESILNIDRKPFRELILANKISAFDFQCYIFARQAALLLRLGNASVNTAHNDIKRPQSRGSSPSPADSGYEPQNLLILADVCQRAVEFITSACRTMRNELSAILKTSTDGKDEGSMIRFPSQEIVAENMIASWTYSTAESVLSRTSTASLTTQLQPLMRQLKPSSTNKTNAKIGPDQELPRRTSSLSPSSSVLQRPPSPEKFPSVTSLDAMRLLPQAPAQTGAQDLAAERGTLHALQRRALSHVGFSFGEWRSGWPDMHLSTAQDEQSLEEVSLDETPQDENANGVNGVEETPSTMNGIRSKVLREALTSEKSFYSAYESMTALILALDLLGERKKSAEALTADLAAVRFHLKDYSAAASYFRQLAPFYAHGHWNELELVMLDLYAQCLEQLDRKEEYVSIALKIIAKQVEAKRRLGDGLHRQMQKPSLTISGSSKNWLNSLIEASRSLERQIITPIERYFEPVSLSAQVRHHEERDSFYLQLKTKADLPAVFNADEVRVCLVQTLQEQRTELWLSAADVRIAPRAATEISVVSKVMNPGLYTLEKVILRSANVIFHQDFSTQITPTFPPGSDRTATSALDNFSLTPIHIFPSPQAFSAQVLHSNIIHLEQPRSLEIHISSGWNSILHGRLHVRAGTAGLRLHTADAGSLSAEPSITDQSQPGVIEFGGFTCRKLSSIKIPYSVESDLKHIVIKLEVSYATTEGDFTFACSPKISILLPLGVNVQDIFKQDALFSKFSVFTASSVPIRLKHCRLEGTAAFAVQSPSLTETELDIFARQPVTLMAKICREQNQPLDSEKLSRRLLLQVQYVCLDEEVLAAVEQALKASLGDSDFHELTCLLTPHLITTLRSQLSVQDYEAIGLLREISFGPFSPTTWSPLLTALPQPTCEAALSWLSSWYTTHATIPLPSATPTPQIHHLTVPVQLPHLQILHTARLRPLTASPRIALDHALPAELSISHTRRWGTDRAPGLALNFVYEVLAPLDTWLVGGQRKAHFAAKEGETVTFALLLLPQRTGQLIIPSVEIRVVGNKDEDGDGEGDELSCETDYRSQAETVEVGTGLESTTVSLDGGAWLLETKGRDE
ncbi:hypothetical protein G7Y79_00071g097090 [Physcia stellaris]|nr:hypothetical protein G7Y79_00071g097090 [Physcia stellaris]